MTATTHPDATAFAARFLARPDDRLGRLVFADWLDERGDDASAAWADYIRTQAEIETLRWDDPDWDELTARAVANGRRVQARLRIAVRSVKSLVALPKLIPPHRCTLDLGHFPLSEYGLYHLPESVAREHSLIPLHFDLTNGYLACPTPADWDMCSKLCFILNRHLHVFGTDPASIPGQLDRAYPFASITSSYSFWTLPEYDPTTDLSPLEDLLNEAVSMGVSTVMFRFTPDDSADVQVVYYFRSGPRERGPMGEDEFRAVVAGVLRRTAERLPRTGPPVDFHYTADGRVYLVSALAPANGLTLWIRPRPDPIDPRR